LLWGGQKDLLKSVILKKQIEMSVNEIREEIIRSVKKMPKNELRFFHEIFKTDKSGN
jgi:hypothetical protein